MESADVIRILEGMIEAQESKVRDLARRLRPEVTDEDLRNPQDLDGIRDNPHFNYEDGILAGLQAARMALVNP